MSVVIKNAKILDRHSSKFGKRYDLHIKNGIIQSIAKEINLPKTKVIKGNNLHISSGWVDIMADYCDPGYEQKETIATGLQSAEAGGFTDVFIVPNTSPSISTRPVIDYILQKSTGFSTDLHVLGAITKQVEGKELAEMMEMHFAGAVAFSDGWYPVQNAQLLVKALEYIKAFNGIIIQIPIYANLVAGGLMNEGQNSVKLGMQGMPPMAESLIVHRDIELLRYTNSRIHFSGISTADSLKLIKAAKKEGLDVTCSITPYHLLYSDDELKYYDSNFKVLPPLRSSSDRKALIKALEEGVIDCIATHHRPHEWDAKTKEFEYAGWGMIGQETCLGMLQEAAPHITMERWVELLSANPRKIFGLNGITIEEGQPAKVTVFDPDEVWKYDTSNKFSKGINSPLLEKDIKGRILKLD